MAHIQVNKDSIASLRYQTTSAIRFLHQYRNLLDTYILDFFTEDLWSRINPKWREVLINITPQELSRFISKGKLGQKEVWPLSLLAFRASCHSLSIPQAPITSPKPFEDYIIKQTKGTGKENVTNSKNSEQTENVPSNSIPSKEENPNKNLNNIQQQDIISWGDAASELSAAAGQHVLLQHVFRRHLKPKKQHEVARLAMLAGRLAKVTHTQALVDVGSGQGHLSRLVAYGHNVRVVCLEGQNDFVKGAKKFDGQLEAAIKKLSRKVTDLPPLPPAPRHSHCHLSPDMDPQAFTQTLSSVWPELEEQNKSCGLLGLHTCGDLAPTMLRIFVNMDACKAIISVGCCYMKLTTELSESVIYPGYPMSIFVGSCPNYHLSYESREVACHSIFMYAERLMSGADNLKVHCYRASLEEIIVKYRQDFRHVGLKSVNNAHLMDFPDYALSAISRLEGFEIDKSELISPQTQHNLSRWMQVVVYYSLRLLTAPVVEAVLLMDRLLYLYEKGIDSVLIPAFDPLLSPRNYVLIAIKNTDLVD